MDWPPCGRPAAWPASTCDPCNPAGLTAWTALLEASAFVRHQKSPPGFKTKGNPAGGRRAVRPWPEKNSASRSRPNCSAALAASCEGSRAPFRIAFLTEDGNRAPARLVGQIVGFQSSSFPSSNPPQATSRPVVVVSPRLPLP